MAGEGYGRTTPPHAPTVSPSLSCHGTPGVGRNLRSKRSFALDLQEDEFAQLVSTGFDRAISGEPDIEEPKFTLGQRETWPTYQALLKHVAEAAKVQGENCGEMETETDRAVTAYSDLANKLLQEVEQHVMEPKVEAFLEDTFVSPQLKNCVFVGHVATDLDSIAGAIGAAALFNGIAVKSEMELNGEIRYALSEVAKLEEPPLFDDVPGCSKPDENGEFKKVCLVDHNEVKQMVKSLRNDPDRKKRIVGVIDHHALSESFSTETPLLIDLRPWGSMSSIVAHLYVRNSAMMKAEIARLLMCAILSDTLNLQSVTTTNADRFAVALLAKIGNVEDPDEVARLMFRAKTAWIVNLGPYAMVRGDQKDFTADGWKFGIAVLEVTDMGAVLEVADKLILELRTLKIEKGNGVIANQLDFAFLFIVNVVKQQSVLLVCGGREYALAEAAFAGCPFGPATPGMAAPGKTIRADQTLCDVGPLVSRKAQFVPAFSKTLNAGFTCHKLKVSSPDYVDGDDDKALQDVLKSGCAKVTVDEDQRYVRDYAAASTAVLGA